jgi:hypothetical protein
VKTTGRRLHKVVDETAHVCCALGKGIIREEVWQDSRGAVVEYNLLSSIMLFMPGITAGWWVTTTVTVIITGISPGPKRSLLLSAMRGCWNDF